MSLRSAVSLILTLQLAWGNTVNLTETFNSTRNKSDPIGKSIASILSSPVPDGQKTENKEVTQQPSTERRCVWWCDETLGIPIAAGLGAIFLISIILFIISCCLWRKRRSHPVQPTGSYKEAGFLAGSTVMAEMELEALTQNVTAECSVTLPGEAGKMEPVTTNDNGICDVENCAPEAAQDTANNVSPPEYNLPEAPDVPPLAE